MVNALSISTGVPQRDRRRDLTELTGSVHNTPRPQEGSTFGRLSSTLRPLYSDATILAFPADYSQVSNTFLIFETVSLGGGVLRTLFADQDASDFVAVPVMLTVFPLNWRSDASFPASR